MAEVMLAVLTELLSSSRDWLAASGCVLKAALHGCTLHTASHCTW
jgi:hypothetical protein